MNVRQTGFNGDERVISLLLDAEPDRDKLVANLSRGQLFVLMDEDVLAGAALLLLQTVCEVAAIAVDSRYRRRGLATRLLQAAEDFAIDQGKRELMIGTGNSSLGQMALYQQCGFRFHSIRHDYFADYPEPVYENGIACLDMLMLRKVLQK